MIRILKHIALLLLPTVLLLACKGPDIHEILEDDTPSLIIKGEKVFRFEKLTCQESFSVSAKEFRVGNDRMSDYFILSLNQLPMTEGMKLNGSITWTTDTDVKTLKNLSFTVLQTDLNQTVWLNCEFENIYVTVRMVN